MNSNKPNHDLYETLGVARDANQSDIEKAYKRARRKAHPDSNTEHSSAEAFDNVQKAYETLSDPNARAEYDETGFVNEHTTRFDPASTVRDLISEKLKQLMRAEMESHSESHSVFSTHIKALKPTPSQVYGSILRDLYRRQKECEEAIKENTQALTFLEKMKSLLVKTDTAADDLYDQVWSEQVNTIKQFVSRARKEHDKAHKVSEFFKANLKEGVFTESEGPFESPKRPWPTRQIKYSPVIDTTSVT